MSLAAQIPIPLVVVSLSRPTPCDPRGCSLPGSSGRGVSQAGTLGWALCLP